MPNVRTSFCFREKREFQVKLLLFVLLDFCELCDCPLPMITSNDARKKKSNNQESSFWHIVGLQNWMWYMSILFVAQ